MNEPNRLIKGGLWVYWMALKSSTRCQRVQMISFSSNKESARLCRASEEFRKAIHRELSA